MYDDQPPFAPLPPKNDCPDGMSHDRTVYYGMAQGLLSALFVSGIIKPFDYEQRRAGLVWEYQWGTQDNPE